MILRQRENSHQFKYLQSSTSLLGYDTYKLYCESHRNGRVLNHFSRPLSIHILQSGKAPIVVV